MASSLPDYIQRSFNLYDRSDDLRSRFGSPEAPGFLKYVDTEGVVYFREIQEVGIPFPPSREMITVGGETDLRLFLAIGYACYETVRQYLPSGRSERAKILDFGVGCARTMRFFFREMDQYECFGCDVDTRAIEYLQRDVAFIEAAVSSNQPPLPYPDSFFDVVYSISVFSHLKRASAIAWLDELSRVLKPSGKLLVSFHGRLALSLLIQDPHRRGLIGISDEEFETQVPKFESEGFAWMHHAVGSEDIDQSQYGISFVSQPTLSEICGHDFEVEDYLEGGIGGWQDLAILGRC